MSPFQLFYRGFLEAALWATTDNSDESGGEPLDRNYDIENIAYGALLTMGRECHDFMKANEALLSEYYSEMQGYGRGTHTVEEQAGHDFFLTKCGHGVGFWDRGLGKLGQDLSAAAEIYGSTDIYVGDDGKLYV